MLNNKHSKILTYIKIISRNEYKAAALINVQKNVTSL